MVLVPCTICARHVHASESLCPFCGAARVAAAPSAAITSATPTNLYVSRTAIVVGLGALATVACINSVYGAPSPDPADDAGTRDADASSVVDATRE